MARAERRPRGDECGSDARPRDDALFQVHLQERALDRVRAAGAEKSWFGLPRALKICRLIAL